MIINKKYLPIKAHFFFYYGGISTIRPFLTVVALQLGIPVIVIGTIGSFALLLTVILKPLAGSAVDAFPKFRKTIFIIILAVMIASHVLIDFLPKLNGDTVDFAVQNSLGNSQPAELNISSVSHLYSDRNPYTGCYVEQAWDCTTSCQNIKDCQTGQTISSVTYNENMSLNLNQLVYDVGEYNLGSTQKPSLLNLSCVGGIFSGPSCTSPWTNEILWAFIILFTIGNISYAIACSISDAICIDLVDRERDYGDQRAWGAVGWGLMAPIGGFLIDWISGDAFEKDYTPAFAILFIFGTIDIFVAIVKLEVSSLKAEKGVWATVFPVLKKPQIVSFFLFTTIYGAFDGVVFMYLFVMQEEMAEGTPFMPHIKFIQGLTLFIQCAVELPFMWGFSWFEAKFGARWILSISFGTHALRLLSLAVIGSFGPVWATLLAILFFSGACMGLGYIAIVVYAGQIAPHGTSATVQSIANICFESLGYALASFLGGILYSKLGGPGLYYAFGGMAICALILNIISLIVFENEAYTKKSITKEESDYECKINPSIEKNIQDPHEEVPLMKEASKS